MMPYSLTGQIPRPTDGSPDLAQRTLARRGGAQGVGERSGDPEVGGEAR